MSGHQPGPPEQPTAPRPVSGNKNRTTWIVVAGVVVLALVAGGIFLLTGSDDDGASAAKGDGASAVKDDGPHKLTAPATVLGSYHLHTAIDQGAIPTASDVRAMGVQDGTGVAREYDKDDGLIQAIMYSGAYGTIKDPQKALDAFIARSKPTDSHVEYTGSPQAQHPAGLKNGLIACQEVHLKPAFAKTKGGGVIPSWHTCFWADHSTMGEVSLVTSVAGKFVSAKGTAKITSDLRNAVRVAK